MRHVTIRRIGVVRAANMAALVLAVVALVLGLFFLVPFGLMTLAVGRAPEVVDSLAPGSRLLGLGLLYVFGVLGYAVMGWLTTAVACIAYNVAAGALGGIRVQVQDDAAPRPPSWG